MKPLRIAYAAGALAAGLVLTVLASCSAPHDRPNVIVVSADTLNRSALRLYDPDKPRHENLEAFAAEAVVFSNAYTTAPWTLPAHSSVFTGRYPSRHGVTRIQQAMPAEIPMLTEALREAGYQTLAFTDGAMLDSSYGHSRGFQQYDGERLDPQLELRAEIPRGGKRSGAGRNLFDRTIAYLRQRQAGDPPFFVFAHTYAIHDYFYLHADRVPAPSAAARAANYLDCLLGESVCNESQWAYLEQRYHAGVEAFDESFGELLRALAAGDDADSTIVILMSDHGEGFAPERQRIHHGGRLHEDQIRIPLMAWLPGVTPDVVESAVSLVDLMPTLLDEAGLPHPEGMDGASLSAALRGERLAARPMYAMEFAYIWDDGRRVYRPSSLPHGVAVIADDRWLIAGTEPELFDMRSDPLQRSPLPIEQAGRLQQLAATAAAWTSPEAEPAPMGEELEEHLRSLGYVQ